MILLRYILRGYSIKKLCSESPRINASYYTSLLVPTPLPRRCIPNSVLFPACLVSNRRSSSLLMPRYACPRFTWSLHLEKPSSTNSLNPLRVGLYCLCPGFILGGKPRPPILSCQRTIHPSIMDSSTQQGEASHCLEYPPFQVDDF